MRTIYLFIVMLSWTFLTANAQNSTELHIGDMMPDVVIEKMVPAINTKISTADFKDKLLILDLWATNCSSCIGNMPRLDSLQQKFGAAIKILPVTSEGENLLNAFWKKNRNTKSLKLATVVEDQVFSNYFRHKTVSHDVWVYKGKVIAITSVEYVNAANIQKVLDGQPVDLPLKYDFAPHFDGATKSLRDTSSISSGSSGLVKYAFIAKYNNRIKDGAIVNADRGGVIRDTATRSVRSYFINQPIYIAYLWALLTAKGTDEMGIIYSIYGGTEGGFEPDRVVWEVEDKSKYMYEKGALTYEDWMKKHAICFESLNPDTGQTAPVIYGSIAKDMNDLLGLDVHFENRTLKALVLTRSSQTDLLKTKNPGIDPSYHQSMEGNVFRLRDNNLTAFIRAFNQHAKNPYAIDDTNYKEKIDMDLNIPSWTDLAAIKKEISKYGLGFKEESREIEVLVFTETGGGFKQKN